MTEDARRIYDCLLSTRGELTVGEAALKFGMTADQAKDAFAELKKLKKLERRADRYCAGFMVGSYGAKQQ